MKLVKVTVWRVPDPVIGSRIEKEKFFDDGPRADDARGIRPGAGKYGTSADTDRLR